MNCKHGWSPLRLRLSFKLFLVSTKYPVTSQVASRRRPCCVPMPANGTSHVTQIHLHSDTGSGNPLTQPGRKAFIVTLSSEPKNSPPATSEQKWQTFLVHNISPNFQAIQNLFESHSFLRQKSSWGCFSFKFPSSSCTVS